MQVTLQRSKLESECMVCEECVQAVYSIKQNAHSLLRLLGARGEAAGSAQLEGSQTLGRGQDGRGCTGLRGGGSAVGKDRSKRVSQGGQAGRDWQGGTSRMGRSEWDKQGGAGIWWGSARLDTMSLCLHGHGPAGRRQQMRKRQQGGAGRVGQAR